MSGIRSGSLGLEVAVRFWIFRARATDEKVNVSLCRIIRSCWRMAHGAWHKGCMADGSETNVRGGNRLSRRVMTNALCTLIIDTYTTAKLMTKIHLSEYRFKFSSGNLNLSHFLTNDKRTSKQFSFGIILDPFEFIQICPLLAFQLRRPPFATRSRLVSTNYYLFRTKIVIMTVKTLTKRSSELALASIR